MTRFTISRGHWYAWTMYPGYIDDDPYLSPIWVTAIEALGQRRIRLEFDNVGYAEGVQDFEKVLRTVLRTNEFYSATEEPPDRLVVIQAISARWLRRCFATWDLETSVLTELDVDPVRALDRLFR